MKKPTIYIIIIIMSCSNFIFGQKENELVDYENFDTALIKSLMVREINRFREKHNLTALKFDTVTDNVADYDASYVNENFFPKSFKDMRFSYFHEVPHNGILLKTINERMDYFSSLQRVNRRLFHCLNSSGFSYSGFNETYYNFAITTLLTWLQAYHENFDDILKFNAEGEEFIGVGISYKKMIGGEQEGYEVYVNVALSTDR